jgi:hypothetical protein
LDVLQTLIDDALTTTDITTLVIGSGRRHLEYINKFVNKIREEYENSDKWVDEIKNNRFVFVDPIYKCYKQDKWNGVKYFLIPEDIHKFLEKYPNENIDKIIAERVIEHLTYEDTLSLFYLLYECSNRWGSEMKIVVPDFNRVVEKFNSMDLNSCQKDLIQITTEIFNEPYDPH